MNTQALLYPMAFYVLYICSFPFINFFMRTKAAKKGEVDFRYFKTYTDKSLTSRQLLVYERHTDNQFQMPLVFLVTCAAALAVDRVPQSLVVLAWAFVASRLLHSFIHLGSNKLHKRAAAYALGICIIFAMWMVILTHS